MASLTIQIRAQNRETNERDGEWIPAFYDGYGPSVECSTLEEDEAREAIEGLPMYRLVDASGQVVS